MRKSDRFLIFLLGLLALLEVARLHSLHRGKERSEEVRGMASMARRLGLTDAVLATDARYARHPSQADHFAPFQDHPTSLEHFPSGTLVAPPPP
jgi:hypothetical protein